MSLFGEVVHYVVATIAFVWLARRLLGANRVSWSRALLAGLVGCIVGGALWWSMPRIDVDDDAFDSGVAIVTSLLVTMNLIVSMQLGGGRRRSVTPRIGPAASVEVARRSSEVIHVAVRHGLGPYSGRRDTGATAPFPVRLRAALEESGTAFVKFGELLAGRPDLVGESTAKGLTLLQQRVTPLDLDVMEPVLREAVGDLDTRFESIDWHPLGSASIPQVDAARLTVGSEVVGKVRRPGAVEEVQDDGQVIRDLSRLLERRSEWARSIGLAPFASSFVDDLERELDHDHEDLVAAALARTYSDGTVDIPAIHVELDNDRVVLRHAPRLADSISTQLDRGDLSIRVRTLSPADDVRVLERLVDRAALAFVAVGLGVVSAMLIGLSKGPYLTTNLAVYDVLASVGRLAGALLVVGVVMEIPDSGEP